MSISGKCVWLVIRGSLSGVSLKPHQRLLLFLEQEALHSLFSFGWFQEGIQAGYTKTELLISQWY